VTLLPWASITANDVTLSNPAGAFRSDFDRFKTIDASFKLFPLLQGAIEIDRVILLEPKVSLEVDKDGRRNWSFHRESRPSISARPAGHAQSSLVVSAVRIIDGEVSYLDQRSDKKYALNFVNMTVSSARSASADGSMMYNGKRVTMALTIATPGTFYNGGPSPATLRIISPPANFAFDGESTIKERRTNGAIDLEVPSLRALAAWLEAPLIVRGNGRGRLLVAGKLDALGKKISVADAKISLDAAAANVSLSIEEGDGHESIFTAKLRAQDANVKELLSAVAGVDQIAGHGNLSIDVTGRGKASRTRRS
jgi:AsmA protein